MKEKTYRRMTKKRSLRGLKLFKQKYLTKQRFFALLAKFHLVREVKSVTPKPLNSVAVFNTVNQVEHKIKTDRGVFNLSYNAQGTAKTKQWWYESLFKKKRLYTIEDNTDYHLFVRVQAECEQFLVKVTPFCEGVATRSRPVLQVVRPYIPMPLSKEISPTDEVQTTLSVTCDFLNARLRVNMDLVVQSAEEIYDGIKELVNRATAQIHNYVEGNPEAINEKLTGVPFDGQFHTLDGKKLIPNCVCHRCSRPVFESSTEGYTAQCVFCDEDFYDFEVRKIDPEMYKDIYEMSKHKLFQILSK